MFEKYNFQDATSGFSERNIVKLFEVGLACGGKTPEMP